MGEAVADLTIVVLALAFILQLVAAVVGIKLIRLTGWRTTWSIISAALILMAVRRLIPLVLILKGSPTYEMDIITAIIALVISVLVVVGATKVASYFSTIAQLQRGEHTGPLSFDRIIQNLTELQQTEEELRESGERLSRIMDTVPSAILTLDTTGHITFANTAAQEILYIKPEVAIGKLYADPSLWLALTTDGKIIPEEERPFMRAVHTGANVEDQQYVAEFPNGTRRTLSVNAAPMHGLSGEIIGVVESLTDITQISILQHTIENQLSLLRQALVPPLPPVISGYKAAFIYRPAFPAESIGGDLYDVFTTESGKIGIMIGDVAGKGVEAAALAAAARSTLHSFTYDLSSTDAAMWHSNAVLESQETLMGEFITAFLAVIDPYTGSFTYSRAGHPPPAILRADGRVDFLEEGDIPIGLFSGQKYSPFKEHLNSRDKIVLYTDGITEARHYDELFWQDGVRRALSGCVDCSPDEVARKLLEEAREWAEGQLQDDIAILVIERSSEQHSEEETHIPPISI